MNLINTNKFIINNKRVILTELLVCFLAKFYGLNWYQISYIIKLFGFSLNIRIKNIPIRYFLFLTTILQNMFQLEKILFKEYKAKLQFKKNLGTYKGLRLKYGLPCRGQRTKSNAKTAKNSNY